MTRRICASRVVGEKSERVPSGGSSTMHHADVHGGGRRLERQERRVHPDQWLHHHSFLVRRSPGVTCQCAQSHPAPLGLAQALAADQLEGDLGSTATMTSWAIRSPRRDRVVGCGSWLTRMTCSSPR